MICTNDVILSNKKSITFLISKIKNRKKVWGGTMVLSETRDLILLLK